MDFFTEDNEEAHRQTNLMRLTRCVHNYIGTRFLAVAVMKENICSWSTVLTLNIRNKKYGIHQSRTFHATEINVRKMLSSLEQEAYHAFHQSSPMVGEQQIEKCTVVNLTSLLFNQVGLH